MAIFELPRVSEESLPHMMHDVDNRFPGHNPYDQGAVPLHLKDSRANYDIAVPFDSEISGTATGPVEFDDSDRERIDACGASLKRIVACYNHLEAKYKARLQPTIRLIQFARDALSKSGHTDFTDLIDDSRWYEEENKLINRFVQEKKSWQDLFEELAREGYNRREKTVQAVHRSRLRGAKANTRTIESEMNAIETLAFNRMAFAWNPEVFDTGRWRRGTDVPRKQTEEALQLKNRYFYHRFRDIPLSQTRPKPWTPQEDNALAAGVQRIPGRSGLQRARRRYAGKPWTAAEDQYILTEVRRCNRDFKTVTLNGNRDKCLDNRGQSAVFHRYIFLMVYRAGSNPSFISPNKEISPDLDENATNNQVMRPATIEWTQAEDESLVYAVFFTMQNPNLQVPHFPSIQHLVVTRDANQCAQRYAVLTKRYWM